jgi:hypothetical protein
MSPVVVIGLTSADIAWDTHEVPLDVKTLPDAPTADKPVPPLLTPKMPDRTLLPPARFSAPKVGVPVPEVPLKSGIPAADVVPTVNEFGRAFSGLFPPNNR